MEERPVKQKLAAHDSCRVICAAQKHIQQTRKLKTQLHWITGELAMSSQQM